MVREIRNAPLDGLNSFGVRASARRIVEFDDSESLRSYLSSHASDGERLAVLGGGNNILLTKDFPGTLLRPTGSFFEIREEDTGGALVRAGAGLEWDMFVEECVRRGLWGAENLSFIPGTVGAAPVQNIGAYGSEASDIIDSVELLDLVTLKDTVLAAAHCSFGYRDSIFKNALRDRVVITAVRFRLGKHPHPNLGYGALAEEALKLGEPTIENIRQAVINIRRYKLPDPSVLGNAGSFFKNPTVAADAAEKIKRLYPEAPLYPAPAAGMVKIPAGWLIERAGWKGRSRNKAGVYHRQALILVNHGGATGKEIADLAQEIINDVRKMFGIKLETEVNIW